MSLIQSKMLLFVPNSFATKLPRTISRRIIGTTYVRCSGYLRAPSLIRQLSSKHPHINASDSPLLAKILLPQRSNSVAVIDGSGEHSYGSLLRRSRVIATEINRRLTDQNITRNVAFLCPNDHTYLVTLLAIWLSGNTAVPLCRSYPAEQLSYYVGDCQAALLVSSGSGDAQTAQELSTRHSVPMLVLSDVGPDVPEQDTAKYAGSSSLNETAENAALVLYTSGTTGSPKGVVLSHANLSAQTHALAAAWRLTTDDTNLHALPLHHLHGVMGALLTPLSAGAAVHMIPKFNAALVWNLLTSLDSETRKINTFMAVPTMYSKLLEDYDKRFSDNPAAKEFIYAVCKEKIRLMISGSSALSESVFERWERVTGHTLLERYGMTEIGLVLSNPLHGPRQKGMVGTPVPGVEVCIARPNAYSASGYDRLAHADNEHGLSVEVARDDHSKVDDGSGELYVRGATVFRSYWDRPQESSKSFTADGWFKTGDIAITVDGSFKILGRSSVDIIKSGGYKISALDVESRLSQHPLVAECSVLGVADVTWGQKVAALVVGVAPASDVNATQLTASSLREWCKTVMPPQWVPSVINFVEEIPRNALGKVNKKELGRQYFS